MSSEHVSEKPLPGGPKHCPHCGAEIYSGKATHCWLCEQSLPAPGAPATGIVPAEQVAGSPAYVPDIRLPDRRVDNGGWAFVGVLITLIIAGLAIEAPGILLILLVLATPALIRTIVAMSKNPPEGGPQQAFTGVGLFFSSLGIVTMVGVAAFAAFYATCFAVCLGGLAIGSLAGGAGSPEWLLLPSIGAGIGVGLLVAIKLVRRLWPRKGS